MPSKKHRPEETIGKLREVETVLGRASSATRMCSLLLPGGSSTEDRPRISGRTTGAEFIATAVQEWLARIGVKTLYIAPGSPWENGYNESFNGSLRDELRGRRDLLQPRQSQDTDRSLAAARQSCFITPICLCC